MFAFSGDFQTHFEDGGSSEEEKEIRQKKATGSASKTKRTKECPGCGAILALSVRECRLCDYQFTSKSMLVSTQSAAQESTQIRERFPFEPERVRLLPNTTPLLHKLTSLVFLLFVGWGWQLANPKHLEQTPAHEWPPSRQISWYEHTKSHCPPYIR